MPCHTRQDWTWYGCAAEAVALRRAPSAACTHLNVLGKHKPNCGWTEGVRYGWSIAPGRPTHHSLSLAANTQYSHGHHAGIFREDRQCGPVSWAKSVKPCWGWGVWCATATAWAADTAAAVAQRVQETHRKLDGFTTQLNRHSRPIGARVARPCGTHTVDLTPPRLQLHALCSTSRRHA